MKKTSVTSQHPAIVVDEYGGMAGLVTMHDILGGIWSISHRRASNNRARSDAFYCVEPISHQPTPHAVPPHQIQHNG